MRKSRFSEEQIIGILKEHQTGLGAQLSGSKTLAMPLSINGGPNMLAWKYLRPSGLRLLRPDIRQRMH